MSKYKTLRNKWIKRLTRKASEHGANVSKHLIELAAIAPAVYERYPRDTVYPNGDFIGTDYLPVSMTVRDWIKSSRQPRLSQWFGEDLPLEQTLDTYLGSGKWEQHQIVHIPYTCKGYDVDLVALANTTYFEENFADLFSWGLIVYEGNCLAIMLDKPYYNTDRLSELLDTIQSLQADSVADSDLLFELQSNMEKEFIEDEVTSFLGALYMSPDTEKLFLSVNEKTEQFDLDNALLNKDWVIAHMWDLIKEHDFEFEDGYMDVRELAKKSPLYEFGYSVDNAVYDVICKLNMIEITRPDLRPFVKELCTDLQSVADKKPPAYEFYNL